MPQSHFAYAREIVRTAAEIRREWTVLARRALAQVAEARAATQKTIIESRELMAEIDAVLAKR
jgi:hypothetical protein